MSAAVVTSALREAEIAELQAFISDQERRLGYRPVSDEAWAELGHGTAGQMATAVVRDEHGAIVASAHASTPAVAAGAADEPAGWVVETVTAGTEPAAIARWTAQVLAAVVGDLTERGATELTWTVFAPTPVHDTVAEMFGLRADRRIHQMRRALPTGLTSDVPTRPFDATRDLAEWVRVNNRAFAWNPEQGHWTEANVLARMDEPWFDPAGFLIHEREGRIAAFCWTKIHPGSQPLLGEIYVIAVDPDFHGLGLGRALTLAGLDSLASRGVTVGMLFVDADNVAAVRLYDTLGFVVHRTDCLYHGRLRVATAGAHG